jgi:hypothetical protein
MIDVFRYEKSESKLELKFFGGSRLAYRVSRVGFGYLRVFGGLRFWGWFLGVECHRVGYGRSILRVGNVGYQ